MDTKKQFLEIEQRLNSLERNLKSLIELFDKQKNLNQTLIDFVKDGVKNEQHRTTNK